MSLLSLFNYDIDNKLISVVGAGGKTSFLHYFLREFEISFSENNKKKLLLTSTTKMYNNYADVIIEHNTSKIIEHVNKNSRTNTFLIFKDIDTINNKLIGYSSSEIDKIYTTKIFDAIISESDGACGKDVKAHDKHEPNNPSSATDIIAIVSLDAIGEKVEDRVHRPSIFYDITKCQDIITKESIVALFNNNNNYFKNSNTKTLKHIVMNKADLLDYATVKNLFQYFSSNIREYNTLSFISAKNNKFIISTIDS